MLSRTGKHININGLKVEVAERDGFEGNVLEIVAAGVHAPKVWPRVVTGSGTPAIDLTTGDLHPPASWNSVTRVFMWRLTNYWYHWRLKS